jgi:hypothetical protein
MEKRLTKSDYLFAVTFIFMLVVAMGAFFYGMQLGQQRSAAKYEELIARQNEEKNGFAAYHQQYLVSFYHTIYQPYREFHKKWFDKMTELETNRSADASSAVKELAVTAEETYALLSEKSMPDSSPLLQDAHKNYMKGLKLFGEGLRAQQSKANAVPARELINQLNQDAYLSEAKNFALKAEKEYYDSIVKWNETIVSGYTPIDVSKPLTVKEWSALNLNAKNDYLANLLMQGKTYRSFTPQDLSVRIDEMISTGQAAKMNLTGLQQVVDLLLATDAVRPGDFLRNGGKYSSETLPQLPFFTNPG